MIGLPRVTEVLKFYSNFDKVNKEILEKAAERGSTVHGLCAAISRGAWVSETMVDEELRGYIKSFEQWKDAQVDEFIITEKRYQDEERKYTGQIDFVIRGTDKELYLVDLKTSTNHNKSYCLQMGAYWGLLKQQNINVKSAMLVYVNKESKFPDIYMVEDLEKEYRIFLLALEIFYYLKEQNQHVRRIKAA